MTTKMRDVLENVLAGHVQGIKSKNKDYINEMANSIDLDKPEEFYFKHLYEKEQLMELALESKLQELNCHNEDFFIVIYLYYSDLVDYLSEIFKKELGSACCADKAGFVLNRILKKQLTGYSNLREKGEVKSFSNPFLRRFSDWEHLVKTCPIIVQGKHEEHSNALMNILNKMRKAKSEEKKFVNDFSKWLLDTDFQYEKIVVNKKEVDYKTLFQKNTLYGYYYLKKNSPHILKIYKRLV